jgi:hypothetical protein
MSYDKPFTKNCDTCGQKIGFSKKDGRTIPVNADGSPHHCQPKPTAPKEDARTGIYGGVSRDNIKLTVKSGGILMSEATADLLKCLTAPDAAIKPGMRIKVIFGKDGKAERVEACPDQPALVSDSDTYTPVGTKNPAPVTTEQAPAPHQDTCTPLEAAPSPSMEDLDGLCDAFRQIKQEDQVRAAMSGLMPSDCVGYRISLAGMVNSVIEMKKISTDAPKTYAELEAEVKRDAVALFLWCDSLTTQKLGKGVQ